MFVVDGDHVKAVPVKIGICDDNYWEITDGLTNGQEIVSGGYRAISRDLDDGKKIKKGTPATTEARNRNAEIERIESKSNGPPTLPWISARVHRSIFDSLA